MRKDVGSRWDGEEGGREVESCDDDEKRREMMPPQLFAASCLFKQRRLLRKQNFPSLSAQIGSQQLSHSPSLPTFNLPRYVIPSFPSSLHPIQIASHLSHRLPDSTKTQSK